MDSSAPSSGVSSCARTPILSQQSSISYPVATASPFFVSAQHHCSRTHSTYLLNSPIHHISCDENRPSLAQPQRTSDSLIFNARIPLGLDDKDAVCRREV